MRKRAEALSNPRRDATMKPEQVVAALQLVPGQVVADIGSGPGYFTLRFAQAVGPTGQVYGVDIEPHFLAELARLAGESGVSNVFPLLTTPSDSGLPLASCDLVFFCSTYRHLDDRVGYLRRLRGRLKPGGRVAILEWRKIGQIRGKGRFERREIVTRSGEGRFAARIGPPETEKLDLEQAVRELREAGFTILASPGFLDYHYFLIAVVQS